MVIGVCTSIPVQIVVLFLLRPGAVADTVVHIFLCIILLTLPLLGAWLAWFNGTYGRQQKFNVSRQRPSYVPSILVFIPSSPISGRRPTI